MKKRLPQPQNNETKVLLVYGEQELPKTLFQRAIHWFGAVVFWMFALIPGIFVIVYGIGGIFRERLPVGRSGRMAYGNDAVGWGWLAVGMGFWILAEGCFLKTGRHWLRWLGWGLCAGALLMGASVLIHQMTTNSR